MLIGAALSTSISTSISRPVRSLAAASREYGQGNFAHRVALDANDEIGALGQAFNVMADEMQHGREELIASREAAEAANRAKSTFLATMSHEIRTPLHGVLGMADLLATTTDLDEKQTNFVNMIGECGNNLLAIITDILDFSKIEAGKLELDNSEFAIGEFVKKTCNVYAVQAQEKGLDFNCTISDEIGAMRGIGDKHRLAQVITNLMGNAIKFTDRGGMAVNVLSRGIHEDSALLSFVVTDTGIGMEEDKLREAFDPFTQADGSNSRKIGGTGLGLAITRELVELMGGSIRVESEIGKGTTFTVDLPLVITNAHSGLS